MLIVGSALLLRRMQRHLAMLSKCKCTQRLRVYRHDVLVSQTISVEADAVHRDPDLQNESVDGVQGQICHLDWFYSWNPTPRVG